MEKHLEEHQSPAIDPQFCYGKSEVHCIQSEQQALLRFKQDLTDPLNRLASWAGDGDCCQWVGVVCNNVTGHVQELNLRSFPPPLLQYFSIEAQYEAAIQSYARSMFGGKDLFVVDGDSVDFERALLVIKGQVLEYTTNLRLLRTIDLSKNNLSGEIPTEVTSLQGLQSLNLSLNNLTGRIPENIGAMGSLESLDFSENQLSGRIPPSMSRLSFLSKLNLSMNNLAGRIPSSTQLQSLNASSFIGNKLCGPPLTDNCTINYAKPDTKDKGSNGGHAVDWFYVGMALGFVVGFWVVWGPLLMNRKWRIMYFQFLDRMGYRLGVFWHKLDRML